jgi:hypothetical protein
MVTYQNYTKMHGQKNIKKYLITVYWFTYEGDFKRRRYTASNSIIDLEC